MLKTLRRVGRLGLVLAMLCLLAACSSGGGDPTPFVAGNAWQGAVPDGATVIPATEFEHLFRSGRLVIALEDDEQTQTLARDQAFLAARTQLAGLADPSEVIQDLVDFAMDEDADTGGIETETEAGVYSLLGVGDQLAAAVAAAERAQDVGQALSDYGLSYGLMEAELRSGLPTPASLAGAGLAEVRVALAQLDERLASVVDLDRVVHVPGGQDAPGVPELLGPQQVQTSGDQGNSCVAPSGYIADYWYPLRNFVSPVKDQARRGTCWAFAALGAVESRELVQRYRIVNLSEQFLVNQVKYRWARDDYAEGYYTNRALQQAIDAGFGLPPESAWVYNRSAHRASTEEGEAAHFVGSCVDYPGAPCSETSHQSEFFCTFFFVGGSSVPYCGYSVSTFTGTTTPASSATQIWKSGQSFELNRYRQYLAQGHVITASLTVYRGFNSPVNGVITDYAKECDVGGAATKKCGGHAVQIVGFLSNQDLATVLGPAGFGGGGLFIVKNSWGCFYGDGGYVYVPADYVQQVFTEMSVLNFDQTRSTQWRQEQATPGTFETPVVRLTGHAETAGLRVPIDLAAFFDVSHSATSNVTLQVNSNVSGVVYSGPFIIKYPAFGQPTLPLTFTATGMHRLTVTATHLGRSASASFDLNVVNQPPTVALSYTGSPQQDTPFPITATVTDPNEASPAGLCSRMTWTASGGATVSGSGCQVQITWPSQGAHTVTARTTDSEGRAGSTSQTVSVGPPPVDPYPMINSYSLRSLDTFQLPGGTWSCIFNFVPSFATVDLREQGCVYVTPREPRYKALLTVANPSAETLSYSWSLYVSYSGAEHLLSTQTTTVPEWHPWYPRANVGAVTNPCRIVVTVNAPDPSRSKTTTVWMGSCTYWTTYVG